MTKQAIQTIAETSTIAEIVSVYNSLKGTKTDVKTLAKRGKAKLVAQIHAMLFEQETAEAKVKAEAEPEDEAKAPAAEQPNGINHFVSQLTASAAPKIKTPKAAKVKPAKAETEAPKEAKKKGPSIRSVAESLLLMVDTYDEDKRPYGLSYEAILSVIHNQFEGAKTTVACLRWYAVHMRERGETVPHRPRATPAVAVAATETAGE